jgi:hypothetical protein
MGLFNGKLEKSLEALVNEFQEIRNLFSEALKDKRKEVDEYKKKAELELEELRKQKQKLEQEEANKSIIIQYYPNKELVVVIEGDVIYSSDFSQEMYEKVSELRKKKDVLGIKKILFEKEFHPDIQLQQKEEELEHSIKTADQKVDELYKDEKQIIETVDNIRALIATGDFVIKGDIVELVGIERSIPKVLVDRFLELHLNDDKDEYEALKNFWRWIVLNPNAEATESFYQQMESYKPSITKEGFLLAYRWVRTVNTSHKNPRPIAPNKDQVEFVSNQRLRIKKVSKKNPKDYWVFKNGNEFTVTKSKDKEDAGELVGNLEDLYLKLPKEQEELGQLYTDGHTGTMDIRIGKEVTMNRKDCDESNTSCSKGLHVCFNLSDHSGNGDTKIIVAVCPRDIINVPRYASKFRCCAYLPLGVLKEDEDERNFLEKGEGLDLLENYFQIKLDELKEQSEKFTVKELTKQRLLPNRLEKVESVKAEEEVQSIVDSFQIQVDDILKNRIQPVN